MTTDRSTWRQLWAATTEAVGDRAVARWLCEEASGLDGDELLAALDVPATTRMVAHLDAMVARYRGGEPLQYVLGHWPFAGVDLAVDRRVLIPRPETELVADVARELAMAAGPPRRVVDLGTGSGAIGLALAVALPRDGTEVWLTDASADALEVAGANLAGIGLPGANVRLVAGDWYGALPPELAGTISVVVSNPPYIAIDDPEVDSVVHRWEPARALFAGADGLDAIRRIIGEAPQWLRPSGWLVVEIGHRQGPAVRALTVAAGLVAVDIRPDLAGRDRVLVARRFS